MNDQLLQNCEDKGISLLDLLLILARRWRMVAGLTIVAAVISAVAAMNVPTIYSSSAKLLVFEFIDQTQALRVGNDGRLVFGGKKGVWRPTDASVIKGVLESTQLRQTVGSRFLNDQHTASISLEKQTGVVTVRVEGSNRETVAQIATAIVNEAAQLAFRMGLLASPVIVLDDVPKIKNLDSATIIMRLLESPMPGVKIKPKRGEIVILSTLSGFFCSVFLAYLLEYFRNLSKEERARFGELKEALRRKSADNKRSDRE